MLGSAQARQVRVNGGDERAFVAEVDLDLAEVLALFEQVCGVRVPQMPSSAFAAKCGVPANAELSCMISPNSR